MGSALGNPLQSIVEQLAERLGRSVIIDSPTLQPLAISAQLGRLDDVRIHAVLHRSNEQPVLDWINAHRVEKARRPLRIPASEELGTLGRVVIPLVSDERALGYLWLIDEPRLTPQQIADAEAAAGEATAVLAQEAAAAAEAADTGRQLMDDLISADPDVRAHVTGRMQELDLPAEGPPYLVVVVLTDAARPDAEKPSVLGRVARAALNRLGSRAVLCGSPRGGELVALGSERRRDLLLKTLRSTRSDLAIGLRGQVTTVETVHSAYPDARFAAEVAARVPDYRRLADWDELGPYAAFQHIQRTPESIERICPHVSTLLSRPSGMYEETVRAYLRLGANARRTAEALHIHRTTLYWRLENVQRMLGIDLSDGDDRLRLHLALKLKDLVSGSTGTPEGTISAI